jgi:carbon-monoxide dehydrogenase catalytic subunit
MAIGTWSVALGIPTHLGTVPPVVGSDTVTDLITNAAKAQLGGYFIVDTDPKRAADKLFAVIQERRAGLGLSTVALAPKPATFQLAQPRTASALLAS